LHYQIKLNSMNSRKKIILVDDSKSFIDALKLILQFRDDVEVIGEAYDGSQFLDMISEKQPDLVLLDINMPAIDGLSAARIGIKAFHDLRIIGVTMSDSVDLHKEMKASGFSGAILKSHFSDHFERALKAFDEGQKYFPLLSN
jgi:DNA-binding NarL/FixJ family response regulator